MMMDAKPKWQRARVINVGCSGDPSLLHAELWVTGVPFVTKTEVVGQPYLMCDDERVMSMHTVADGVQMVVPLDFIELLARARDDFAEYVELEPYNEWLKRSCHAGRVSA